MIRLLSFRTSDAWNQFCEFGCSEILKFIPSAHCVHGFERSVSTICSKKHKSCGAGGTSLVSSS
jgi:hypothetical protein